jgi:hypothetical protein
MSDSTNSSDKSSGQPPPGGGSALTRTPPPTSSAKFTGPNGKLIELRDVWAGETEGGGAGALARVLLSPA